MGFSARLKTLMLGALGLPETVEELENAIYDIVAEQIVDGSITEADVTFGDLEVGESLTVNDTVYNTARLTTVGDTPTALLTFPMEEDSGLFVKINIIGRRTDDTDDIVGGSIFALSSRDGSGPAVVENFNGIDGNDYFNAIGDGPNFAFEDEVNNVVLNVYSPAEIAATGVITITDYAKLVSGTDDSVTVGGVTFTAQTGVVVLGAATFQAATANSNTATSLAAQINGHAVAGALVTATANVAAVELEAITPGTGGNSINLVYADHDTNVGLTVSGATLVNGESPTYDWAVEYKAFTV